MNRISRKYKGGACAPPVVSFPGFRFRLGLLFMNVAIMEFYIPDPYGGLELDLERHLRLPPTPVCKMDGDFGDPESHQVSHIGHLDQEDVPARTDAIQGHGLQCLPAPHAVTGRHVMQRGTKDGTGIEVPETRKRFPPDGPVLV